MLHDLSEPETGEAATAQNWQWYPSQLRAFAGGGVHSGCRRIFLFVLLAVSTRIFAAPARQPVHSEPSAASAAAQAVHAEPPADNPAADPRAVVIFGKARFTVLTDQLIRMEWSATGRFEDRASLVFINRHLPAPHFLHSVSGKEPNRKLTIKTAALTLTYIPAGDGRFTAGDLSIQLDVSGRLAVWRPGESDPGNLEGTTRTLDGALGDKTKEPIGPGLVSRSGWSLVDDTTRPLFDSSDFRFLEGEKSPWPWVMERPAEEEPGKYLDWYFFGY